MDTPCNSIRINQKDFCMHTERRDAEWEFENCKTASFHISWKRKSHNLVKLMNLNPWQCSHTRLFIFFYRYYLHSCSLRAIEMYFVCSRALHFLKARHSCPSVRSVKCVFDLVWTASDLSFLRRTQQPRH